MNINWKKEIATWILWAIICLIYYLLYVLFIGNKLPPILITMCVGFFGMLLSNYLIGKIKYFNK